jgi:hypothetical protein
MDADSQRKPKAAQYRAIALQHHRSMCIHCYVSTGELCSLATTKYVTVPTDHRYYSYKPPFTPHTDMYKPLVQA